MLVKYKYYLDYKKAFNSIVHNILLHKLWSFGITDNLWKWLRAYLTNQIQCVSVNGTVSDFLPVMSCWMCLRAAFWALYYF